MHIWIAVAAFVLSLASGGPTLAIALSADGKTDYTIVVAADAIVPEQTAAQELQSHLQAVTGAQLPILQDAEAPETARQIVIGPNNRFRAAFPDLDIEALKSDGIVMKTVGDTLYLAGGRPRGTLYAVYTFLEDVVGCRWWSSTESFVPNKPTLEIPQLDTVYVPKLQYREAFCRDAFNGVFAARCKCNGHFERIPEEYGGHYRIIGWCHTFDRLLPPEKYFAEHPEWYSEIDGERTAQRAQLCLTNEEMRAEFVRNALAWIRKEPEAGIISISQNDHRGACQCEECRRVVEEEGSESGPLIRFVNAVAEEIEKEFPDFWIETLAYSYTRQAPRRVKPRANVVIRLCSIECSFSQPLATGPQNEKFAQDIKDWSAMAHQLYIWNYVTNFADYILPHPNMRSLAPDIRFFVEHKAIGLFEQGDSGCSCGDFPELRAWLLAHLMWNPDRDENALIAEFLEGYYGPAAAPLQQYIDLIHDAVEKSGTYLRCYMNDTSAWLTPADLNQATELFNEAEKSVADDAVLSERVRRARMPLDHVWLKRYYGLKRIAKAAGKPLLGPEDPMAFCEEFIRTAHAFKVGNYREGRSFEQYEPILRARFRPPAPPPTLCEGLPEDEWADIQDHELTLHQIGKWVSTVDDEKASDGKAARMPANHHQWAVQYPVSADLAAFGPYHCYVVVRCECKADEGEAFDMGIYDTKARKNVVYQKKAIKDVADGEYKTFDLGVQELSGEMYFWFAPRANPDQVEAVYVDRIFCIREK